MNAHVANLHKLIDQMTSLEMFYTPAAACLMLYDAASEIFRLEQRVSFLEAECPQTDHYAPEAYWMYGGEGLYDVCSHCRQKLYLAIPMKFCPECGAKFRKTTPAERYPCPTCTCYDEGAPQCKHCSPANNFLYYQGANHADHLKNPQ